MIFRIFLLLAFAFTCHAVENSIIPSMEHFERIENLPTTKFSKAQYQEIAEGLSHLDERIRVVSYNILFPLYDHKLEPVNRFPERLPRLVALIEEMQPDIIGVQELYPNQLEALTHHLEKTFAFYARSCDDGELNGIFYRKERFEVIDSAVYSMTKNSETLTMVQLRDVKTGSCFAVFNVHLAFSNIEKRDIQVHIIAEKVNGVAKEMPVILTGDFNSFPTRLDLKKLPFYDGDYIERLLTQETLRDAKGRSLLGHLGPLSTFSNAPDDKEPFKGTGTPGVFLDHIFVSKGIQVLFHAIQPGTVGGHFPSDHLPVLSDLIIECK